MPPTRTPYSRRGPTPRARRGLHAHPECGIAQKLTAQNAYSSAFQPMPAYMPSPNGERPGLEDLIELRRVLRRLSRWVDDTPWAINTPIDKSYDL